MSNWHEITPLSRMLAIIAFVGIVPALSFYLGMQYQDMLATQHMIRTYDFPKLEHFTGISISPLTEPESSTTPRY